MDRRRCVLQRARRQGRDRLRPAHDWNSAGSSHQQDLEAGAPRRSRRIRKLVARGALPRAALLADPGARRSDQRSRSRRTAARAGRWIMKLRVMTYNVRGMMGLDRRASIDRIARVIEGSKPDLVALQELTCVEKDGIDPPGELAKALGMQASFVCSVITKK